MKILIASDSFKGCMSSCQANAQIEKGILKADPQIHCETFEISDGGEGMVDAFASCTGARIHTARVRDLYGKPITAKWALNEKDGSACIEAASVVGLPLYKPGQRKPMLSSSYGLGLLCKEVLKNKKVRKLVIGLGGTGCNDGGMGLCAAFGAVFYDRQRRALMARTENLSKIAFIDKRGFHLPDGVELIAACDVTNHLLGLQGATRIFGRQKGLSPSQMDQVEKGMSLLNAKVDQTFHVNMDQLEGSGAAGGLGGMLCGVFKARMMSGIEVLEQGGLSEKISQADYIFTGEGQTNAQSAQGKVVSRIAKIARKSGIPVVCVSGAMADGCEQLYDQGVSAMFSTADRAMSFPFALAHGPQKLEQEAYNLMRLILAAERRMNR